MKGFGFGDRSGIELPSETRGLLRAPRNWGATSILSLSSRAPSIAFLALPGFERVRSLGMIGAADLTDEHAGYLGQIGWRVFDEARKRGAYLRPLGSTVYVCPPLTISEGDLETLLATLEESVVAATHAAR